jgi:hypothetical protein
VFEWLDDMGDVPSPRFENWAKDLSGANGGSNWSGAMFELYVATNEIPTSSISTFSDIQGGKQGMDIILDNAEYLELKARIDGPTSITFKNMVNQFRRNLGVVGGPARYPPEGIYRYVIKGPYRQDIVDALVEVAEEARKGDNLKTAFGRENIQFVEKALPWDNLP